MPIYEYVCEACGKEVDLLQKMSDPAPEKCPSCSAEGKMVKRVSRTSFQLKGGGWYSDLYGSVKKDGGGKSESSTPSTTSSSTSSTPAASPASSTASTPSTSGSATTSSSGGSGSGTSSKS
ncbi:MAG: zinc ribbon domain-containing protein [Myxococcaceae bacterium]|nr:zinc ribbon domain-containing protein [Myxococcaceae bacterium]